jgi:PAS domain S-box-containing protein
VPPAEPRPAPGEDPDPIEPHAAVIEAFADPIYWHDLRGRVQGVNNAFERLIGLGRAQIVNRLIHDLPMPADLQLAPASARLLRDRRARLEAEQSVLRQNGSTGLLTHIVTLMTDPTGRPIGVTGTLRDVTRQRRDELDMIVNAQRLYHTQQELIRVNVEVTRHRREAEQSDAAKSAFLANMSHELRTPMNAILGFGGLIADRTVEGRDLEAAGDAIRRNGGHLMSVLNDILDLSRIEAGEARLQPEPTPPADLLRSCLLTWHTQAEQKGLTLELQADPDLPEAVLVDAKRVRQVVLNLLGNAVKFTRTGGVTLKASVPALGRLRVDVVDTGPGMSEKAVAGLFTRFSDVTTIRDSNQRGAGLGLEISKRLARLLGGDLTVETRPGVGSTFTLDIKSPPARWEAPRVPLTCELPAAKSRPGRVLIADDCTDNRRLTRLLLRGLVDAVDDVPDGAVAIEAIRAAHAQGRPYDAVLLDMQMPVLSGTEVAAELRDQPHRPWLIAVTAHAMSGDRQTCLDAGCDDYLAKPIDRNTLADVVERAAQRKRAVTPDDASVSIAPTRASPLQSEFAHDADMAPFVAEYLVRLRSELETGLALACSLSQCRDSTLDELERWAHRISGSAGGYGFPSVTRLARHVCESIRAGASAAVVREAVRGLNREIARAVPRVAA